MPLHPIVVHFPIALAVLVPVIALVLLVGWRAGWWSRRTWLVAAGLAGLLTASSFVALRTGEAEEERVEATVPEAALEVHEERAEVFAWFTLLPFALALAGAVIPKERAAQWVAGAAVASTLGAAGLAYGVGHAGGEIVYTHGVPTIAAGTPTADVAWSLGGDEHEEHEEDDDD